ncbi:putative protein family FLILHELTA [Niveomyces insectorum RCEF 264]|uniref:Mitochondrial seryl-tRNA synthetase n=1 Tax=Niveomyces insectorum RCEF 264 TaxID=1081102 RepID=A0A167Y6K1_9HYPO|nr:putative protein family FLILHELTA [Niveomyces insectorum RCEF 264]
MPFPRSFNPSRFLTAAAMVPPSLPSAGRALFRPGRCLSPGRPHGLRRATARSHSTRDKPSFSAPPSAAVSRAERILARLPPRLQKYTRRFKDAPVSHGVAFLLLHEITAIVPLLGLFGLFHYATAIAPLDYMLGHYGGQVADGVRRFERYFRRKGWFGFGDEGTAGTEGAPADTKNETNGDDAAAAAAANSAVRQRWTSADAKYRIVVEVGLAYAITKVLLPVRIVMSLWATPWFAGVLARVRRLRRPKP